MHYTAIVWVIVAIALGVAEAFTGTLVLIMMGLGALAAAGAAALGAGVGTQAIVFAIASALALLGLRPVLRRHAGGLNQPPETRMGVEAIEGSNATVLETIDHDHGLIKIEGELWRARPYDATQTFEVGEQVQIIEIKGATALVWRN